MKRIKKVKITIELSVNIGGKAVTDDYVCQQVESAMRDAIPPVICDDDEADVLIFADSWDVQAKIKEAA